MTPLLGIWASSYKQYNLPKSYDSIATTTVGAGGASTITFSSIPQTYTHLQIRYLAKATRANVVSQPAFRFNSDTGSNYTDHYLNANGSTIAAGWDGTNTLIYGSSIAGNSANANTFGVGVFDILDYTNTNKYKTVRSIGGDDDNGSGYIDFRSGLWMSTSAINTITITEAYGNNFAQYSSFALYGIKGS